MTDVPADALFLLIALCVLGVTSDLAYLFHNDAARLANAGNVVMYQEVIDRICSDLSVGVRPWLKPWSGDQAAGMVRASTLRNNLQGH